MFAAGKTAAVSGAGPDAQFNYVTMLLHGDGTNGAQNNTFLDSSTNNFTITRNGNTTQGSFSPYGSNWSNFTPSSAYFYTASSANLNLGAGSFTLEFWVNPSALTNEARMVTVEGSSTIGMIMGGGGAGGSNTDIQVNQFGTATLLNASSVLSVGTWTHVAVTYNGTTSTLWVNGVSQNTASGSVFPNSNSSVTVFGSVNYANSAFKGYISNLRLLKGTCLYTTSFTPSTTPLTAITNTALLTCQSNRFFDASANAFGFTFSGSPSVQRFNPFGTSTAYSTSVIGGSGYFDGSGDYLTAPDDASLNLSADFTVEAWVNLDNISSEYCVFHNHTSNVNGVAVTVNSGAPRLLSGNGSWSVILDSSITIKPNTWNHIAGTRSGNTYTIWVNGVSGGTASSATTPSYSGGAQIGRFISSAPLAFPGYMSNLRVVKGTAVYTTTFTPSTTPLTAISGTSLLLYYTNGAIFDNAMMNDLETGGNAQISTSVKKYGTGSIAFDGTGDFLKFPKMGALGFGTGNFTIEMWVYPNANQASYAQLLNKGPSEIFNLGFYPSTTQLNFYNGGFLISASSSLTIGAWTHVALVRNGTTLTLYQGGVSVGSATYTTDAPDNYGHIGCSVNEAAYFFNGYIDDLRITNGIARYTGTFTPPTSALSDTGPY